MKKLIILTLFLGISLNAYGEPPDVPKPDKPDHINNTYIKRYTIKDKHEVELIGRLYDTRKTCTEIYANYDFNNEVYGVGVRFTFKFGESYEQKLIGKLIVALMEKELNEKARKIK